MIQVYSFLLGAYFFIHTIYKWWIFLAHLLKTKPMPMLNMDEDTGVIQSLEWGGRLSWLTFICSMCLYSLMDIEYWTNLNPPDFCNISMTILILLVIFQRVTRGRESGSDRDDYAFNASMVPEKGAPLTAGNEEQSADSYIKGSNHSHLVYTFYLHIFLACTYPYYNCKYKKKLYE